MKKLILLLFIPYTLISQNFKIEHKVNDDKTVDFSYRNLSANTVTVIVNFSFLENSMSSTKVVEKVSKPEGKLFKLKPANKEQNIGFNYSYFFFNYNINPKVDHEFVYILPYKKRDSNVCRRAFLFGLNLLKQRRTKRMEILLIFE